MTRIVTIGQKLVELAATKEWAMASRLKDSRRLNPGLVTEENVKLFFSSVPNRQNQSKNPDEKKFENFVLGQFL